MKHAPNLHKLVTEAEAQAMRREAEQGSLRERRYASQRAALFARVADLLAQEGQPEQAREAGWDAQLCSLETNGMAAYLRSGPYFRSRPFAPTYGLSSGETLVQEDGATRVADESEDGAIGYFARRLLADSASRADFALPPLMRARYADYLFDRGGLRSRSQTDVFARRAIDAYLMLANEALPDDDLTVEANGFLFRAAVIARDIGAPSVTTAVSEAALQAIGVLREDRRLGYVPDAARALLVLGESVDKDGLLSVVEAVREAVLVERAAGRLYRERLFLAVLANALRYLGQADRRRETLGEIVWSYQREARVRQPLSLLDAAALFEDAARVARNLAAPDKAGTEQLVSLMETTYDDADGGAEFGRCEIRGKRTMEIVDEFYQPVFAGLPFDSVLYLLGALGWSHDLYPRAEHLARIGLGDADGLERMPAIFVRDDCPERRVYGRDELLTAQTQRQFVRLLNVMVVVVGTLLERPVDGTRLDELIERYLADRHIVHPWDMPFVRRGLERYIASDYSSALHLLVPRVGRVLRTVLQRIGVITGGLESAEDGFLDVKDELLASLLNRRNVQDVLGENLWHYLHTVLVSPEGLDLQTLVAGGMMKRSQATRVRCLIVIHLLLSLVSYADYRSRKQDQDAPDADDADGRKLPGTVAWQARLLRQIVESAAPNILPNGAPNLVSGLLIQPNPLMAMAGVSVDDPFAADVSAHIAAERQREREAAVSSNFDIVEGDQ